MNRRLRLPRGLVGVTVALGLTAAFTGLSMVDRPAVAQDTQTPNPEGVPSEGSGEPPQGAPGAGAARQPAAPAAPAAGQLDRGRQLYLSSCVTCHGADGTGTIDGPSLRASGEAKTDFYLRTGRMPLAVPVPQPPAKPPAFNDGQIRDLVAYVGSLCLPDNPCPPVPTVQVDEAKVAEGQELFSANCAACHNSSGIGGALSNGRLAPSLQHTDPVQVAEAVRTGPGQMPQFGADVITDEQLDAIVTYVRYLHEPESPGGLPLGFTGPVAEGFVALLLGLGALLLASRWITREPAEDTVGAVPPAIERTEP
jgi:ubiquinol-cytochrome c reductase cytochrome c subunit